MGKIPGVMEGAVALELLEDTELVQINGSGFFTELGKLCGTLFALQCNDGGKAADAAMAYNY